MLLLALSACSPGAPDAVLAYVRDGAEYTVAPRALPALEDPGAVSGALGTVRFGGRMQDERYTGGAPIAVRYVVSDGVAVPLDREGLLLWSFYAHLSDARDALAERGVPLDPVLPVDIAWNPAVNPFFELAPVDNAAYAVGSNLFVLLPDGDARAVPLVANAGVVAHELGHAVFHLLTVGDPLEPPLAPDTSTEAGKWQGSLHEGFADALAALLLDDPRFLDPSLALPARRLDGDATLTAALLPPAEADALALLPSWDPYPLGTVFASVAWDVRVTLDDPDRAFALLVRGVEAWRPEDASELDGARFLAAWVAAADVDERAALCDAIERRMGATLGAEGCG